jgi:hypothetical protein
MITQVLSSSDGHKLPQLLENIVDIHITSLWTKAWCYQFWQSSVETIIFGLLDM